MSEIVVIIPSYEPDKRLVKIVEDIQAKLSYDIVVVNDGSAEKYDRFYEEVEKRGCKVLKHAVNQGKGRGLKTAFNYCLNTYPEMKGAITADSDGQHSAESIEACADALIANPDSLVVGCRNFRQENVPFKNRFGNLFTVFIFKTCCGIDVSDTQTGLRGIPREFMKKLLATAGERFEYETNMLIDAKDAGVPFYEVTIDTIYQGEEYTSHFNKLTDSLKIYKTIARFILSSLCSTLIDLLLFKLFTLLFEGVIPAYYILASTVSARVISSIFNFTINKKVVFKNKSDTAVTFIKYAAVCATVMLLSAGLVTFIHGFWKIDETIIKAIVDTILFLLSYSLQREFVFRTKKK